jgi:hypothetical protein
MRRTGEVLSDTELAALLGEDTFAGLDRGLERLWDALRNDDEADRQVG